MRSRVPAGQPIYVAPRRSDLVRFNDPLVYVLTERDNPTPQDFGLQTGAIAQLRQEPERVVMALLEYLRVAAT